MHFDPYLSPPLPSSPPSASPTPPPVSTTIDYKTLAAQKDRVNDSLRLKNANLERALAEVKKANSRQKSLLPPHSSLPPPSPSRPPIPPPPPPPPTKRDARGNKFVPPTYDRPTRDIWGGVHAADHSPHAPTPAPPRKLGPWAQYEADGGWVPPFFRYTPEVKVRERRGMPCDGLGVGVGGMFGEEVGGVEEEEREETQRLEIGDGGVGGEVDGGDGVVGGKDGDGGDEGEEEEEKGVAAIEAELEAWMGEGGDEGEGGGEEVSPEMEKTTAPLDGKPSASPSTSPPKQESDGEEVSPPSGTEAAPVDGKLNASSPPASPKQRGNGELASPQPDQETKPTEPKSSASSATSSPKRKADFEEDGEKSPPKKSKPSPETKTSPFASFATPGPSPFAAPSSSSFGTSGFSSFGSGGSFATGGLAGDRLKIALPLLATKWSASFTTFFEHHTPTSNFPNPPTMDCPETHCATSNSDRALKACPHTVLKMLRLLVEREKQNGGKDAVKAWMKKMRNWWHPDHVGTMAGKERRGEWEVMAKEVFCELCTVKVEIEEEEEEEQ
ncbi:unnamed protein product [Zymoseptoria tritici ST99CH_3D7]|uniref:Uncharacterized protein n=1 Tax=Zymoseptoria tritici (strain ST99CH_3D7) TaxID=1276538 RepID=A0A1X7S5Z1_ZYMT9|nr:unnamed protein product [Zymoseptoria tritici ST99CH_3D7]